MNLSGIVAELRAEREQVEHAISKKSPAAAGSTVIDAIPGTIRDM
jgi:hypothetical protein